MLPAQGRAGVVVDARPLGDAEGGRQLVALRIKAGAAGAVDSGAGLAPDRLQPQGTPADDAATSSPATGLGVARTEPLAARLHHQLNAVERADLAKLQQRDQQVRQEEKAHAAVAGDLAGPINYIYQRGPDGRQYAVGGSVSVQASTVSGDPIEAKRLSGRMAAAAHAATSPSAQDLATAWQAYDFGSRLAAPIGGTRHGPDFNLTL
ncbi:MAG: putative metalloprotease CJM1_0395 family protein [Geminicoccaceae bacterium]